MKQESQICDFIKIDIVFWRKYKNSWDLLLKKPM